MRLALPVALEHRGRLKIENTPHVRMQAEQGFFVRALLCPAQASRTSAVVGGDSGELP